MKMFEPTLALMSDERLLSAIKAQQAVQKTNPPSSAAWQAASSNLAPLFNEMKLRYPNGVGPAV